MSNYFFVFQLLLKGELFVYMYNRLFLYFALCIICTYVLVDVHSIGTYKISFSQLTEEICPPFILSFYASDLFNDPFT